MAMDQSHPYKWYMWRFNDPSLGPDRIFAVDEHEDTFERHEKRSDFDEAPEEEEAMYFVPRLRKRSDVMRSPVGKRVTANVRFGSPLSSSGYILDYSLEDVDNMREVARSIRESNNRYDQPLRSVKVRVPYLRLFYT
ncbi:hypothetical protein AAVH_15191 [Aphelenchoides avenae]|nr:hypothetical protein AAVH_15191 [Aphelenchus avenae]